MAKQELDPVVREYMASIGSKGGQAKVTKGVGALSKARRKEIARKGVEARRKKAAKVQSNT